MSWDDRETDEEEIQAQPLNWFAVAGLIASFALALGGLFVLPAVETLGFTTRNAFWAVLAVEFVAAIGVGISARKLRG